MNRIHDGFFKHVRRAKEKGTFNGVISDMWTIMTFGYHMGFHFLIFGCRVGHYFGKTSKLSLIRFTNRRTAKIYPTSTAIVKFVKPVNKKVMRRIMESIALFGFQNVSEFFPFTHIPSDEHQYWSHASKWDLRCLRCEQNEHQQNQQCHG